MIAAVVIDKWKLAIFKKHLDAGGFTYEEGPGITADTLSLKVTTPDAMTLLPFMEAAQSECKRKKMI